MRNGFGIYIFLNKDVFKGLYLNGKREGFGQLNEKDWNTYLGAFQDNEKYGRGLYYKNNILMTINYASR